MHRKNNVGSWQLSWFLIAACGGGVAPDDRGGDSCLDGKCDSTQDSGGGMVGCGDLRTCGDCVTAALCGWCDGACVAGTSTGPSAGRCTQSPWAWSPEQCADVPVGHCVTACDADAAVDACFEQLSECGPDGRCFIGYCASDPDCWSPTGPAEICVLTPRDTQCGHACSRDADCAASEPYCFTDLAGRGRCVTRAYVCMEDAECGTGGRSSGVCAAQSKDCICHSDAQCGAAERCMVL